MKVAIVMMMVLSMVSVFGAESVGLKHYEKAIKDGFRFCAVCKKAISEKDCKMTNLAMKYSDDKAFVSLANRAMKKFINDRKNFCKSVCRDGE